jgi:hypothetical protein
MFVRTEGTEIHNHAIKRKVSIEKNSASKHTTLEPHDKEAEKT